VHREARCSVAVQGILRSTLRTIESRNVTDDAKLRALFRSRARYLFEPRRRSPLPISTLRRLSPTPRRCETDHSISQLDSRKRASPPAYGIAWSRVEQLAFSEIPRRSLDVANGLQWRQGHMSHSGMSFRLTSIRGCAFASFRCRGRMCEERECRIDLEELRKLIDARTRVVAIIIQYAQLSRRSRALVV